MGLLLCITAIGPIGVAQAQPAHGTRGMVATVHPLATDEAVRVLRSGGNAVDAAVAAALMLGVVDNHNSGLGGGCLILLRLADSRLVAIDGRETAPAAATRDMYMREGNIEPQLSQTGPLAVAVPGALAAYAMAIENFGKRRLADLLQAPTEVAERGFAIDAAYSRNLLEIAPILARFPDSSSVLLKPDGNAYQEGDILIQPDLARTYRAIATEGLPWFYRGPFAQTVGRWMDRNGGMLTAEDFAQYRAKVREPIKSDYRGYTIVGFPPPSSGGIHVAQILNILEPFDLAALQRQDPPKRIHVMAEAMKLAFVDRAYWLGDSDFVLVPRRLVEKEYAQRLTTRIDLERATQVAHHAQPPDWQSQPFGQHTTHIAAADADGNWVAITATVNTPFGSKIIVPGTGVVLNNQMDDFSVQPGVPNAFELVGGENNAIAPGKRPLSSMSPTIVLEDGEPILTLGAAGGPKIITQVVQAIVNYVDLGMPIDQAIAVERFHHQWSPDWLMVEQTMPADLVQALTTRGHIVRQMTTVGVTQAIARSANGQELIGVHDPRVSGKASGY
jgi:gamma-glutamyltranspeptidase/glutathione hydrolase